MEYNVSLDYALHFFFKTKYHIIKTDIIVIIIGQIISIPNIITKY